MVNDAYAPELLRSLFLYDPMTGRLHHKANRRRVKAGSYADSTRRADGYRQVALRLDGKQYQLKAHRVAWILEHGDIPDGLPPMQSALGYAAGKRPEPTQGKGV